MNGHLFEGEGIILCLCVVNQEVSEVGDIVWRVLGSFFVVDKFSCKIAASIRMELITDKATDAKKEMRPNTSGMPFTFLYFS